MSRHEILNSLKLMMDLLHLFNYKYISRNRIYQAIQFSLYFCEFRLFLLILQDAIAMVLK